MIKSSFSTLRSLFRRLLVMGIAVATSATFLCCGAVTACLLAARDHFSPDELKIESDGQWEDGDWNEGAKLYQQVFGRAPANPINRSDEPPAGPGIDLPDRPEEWSPLSLVVVAGIGVGIVWLLVRPHWAFIIFVERGRIDRVRGDAPRLFLLEVDDICRQFDIPL